IAVGDAGGAGVQAIHQRVERRELREDRVALVGGQVTHAPTVERPDFRFIPHTRALPHKTHPFTIENARPEPPRRRPWRSWSVARSPSRAVWPAGPARAPASAGSGRPAGRPAGRRSSETRPMP